MKSIAGEIERLKQIVEENPQSTQFARLADYLQEINRIPEAMDICKKGLESHPNYANAHFVLGQCYFKSKDFDAAESEFNKVLLHDPEHIQAHFLQAKIMKERGWSNAYLLWLKRAAAVDPLDKLSQSLISDFNEEEMEQEETIAVEETYQSSDETVVEESDYDEQTDIVVDEVAGSEKFADSETEKFETSAGDEEQLIEEEVAKENQEEDKRYEYIIDDIFKDEVTTEESAETLEEEIDSYETPEELVEETAENAVESTEAGEISEEEKPPEDDEEEIVTQIRDKVEQFDEEEEVSQGSSPGIEEVTEDIITTEEEPEEESVETFTAEVQTESGGEQVEEKEEAVPAVEEVSPEESEEKQTEPPGITPEVKDEATTVDRERAAREVFGDDDFTDEISEEVEVEPEIEFADQEPETAVEEPPAPEGMAETELTTSEMERQQEEKQVSPDGGKEPIVTSTLGEIYAAQGHFAKAIGVYEILQKKHPENPLYQQKIDELKKKQEEAEQNKE